MQFKHKKAFYQIPLLFGLAVFTLSCSSGGGDSEEDNSGTENPDTNTPDPNNPTPLASDLPEPLAHYSNDGYDTLDVLTLNVRTASTAGVCTNDDISGCTLDDINTDIDGSDDFKPKIDVHVVSSEYAEDTLISNAELKLRGDSSRREAQKSYSIKLDKDLPLWRNERRWQLNKHPEDETRIRNKLSFDLMRDVKHLNSLRTQFVQLFIEDNGQTTDYGLFTHVERVGKNYTENRGYVADSPIYKANNFTFTRLPDRLQIDVDGAPVDKDQFERNLEIEEGDDHSKLIEMLDALNDPDSDKSAILDQYFNENNIVTWLAVNILVGNVNTVFENYFLLNPKDTDLFYYLPWDYDGAFKSPRSLSEFSGQRLIQERALFGVARWWDSVLIRTWLSQDGSYQKLSDRVTQLRESVFTDQNIIDLINSYLPLIQPILSSFPDLENLEGSNDQNRVDELLANISGMAANLSANYDQFINDPGWPMPVTLGDTELDGDIATFNWSPSVDFQGDTISYKVELSENPDFSTTVFNAENIAHTIVKEAGEAERITFVGNIGLLPPTPTTLYWRVITNDSADPINNTRPAAGRINVDGETFYGIAEFM